jgi:hypothetical protein
MIIGFTLFVLFLLALWHFVAEAILAPSWRAMLRLRLFAIRDNLRNLRIADSISDQEFEESQRRINNIIRLTPAIDFFWMVKTEFKIRKDAALCEKLERRRMEFEANASLEVKELTNQAIKVALDAVGANSVGWMVYLIPIAVCLALWKRARREIRNLAGATDHELDFTELRPCPA